MEGIDSLNVMGCYKLIQAVIAQAFEFAYDRNKAGNVLVWAQSERGDKFFDAYCSISGYDWGKIKKMLIDRCERTMRV